MNCCDEFGNCRQGRDCPVRNAAAAATEVGADDSEQPEPTSLLVTAALIVAVLAAAVLVY